MNATACTTIEAFLQDIKRNPNNIRIGDASIDAMIASMSTCLESDCNFMYVEPTDEYKEQLKEYGTVLSNTKNPYIDRPTSVKNVVTSTGSEIWISNLNSEIVRFDNNFSYLGGLRGLSYGNPANSNAFRNCIDFDASYDLGTGITRVIMVSSDSIAKVYDTDANGIFQLTYTIGTDGTPGNAPLLNNCTGCAILPNNDFVIVNKNGEGNNNGSVVQYSGTTGSPIAIRLEDTLQNLGSVWDNECTNPTSIRVHQNKVYISTERDEIGVWDITDPLSWVYETAYNKPDIEANTVNPTGLAISGNTICTGSKASSQILSMFLDSHDLDYCTGVNKFDDVNNPNNFINEFGSVDSVDYWYDAAGEVIGVIVCDITNNRVQVIPGDETIDIQFTYTIPDGKEIKASTNCVGTFDAGTGILTVPLNDIEKVNGFYLILENIKPCPL